MKIRFILVTIVLFVISSFFVAGVSFAQLKDDNGKLAGEALLQVKCSKCHGVERPLGKSKNAEEWESTVDRMRNKDTSWITESDAKEIVWFLSSKSLFETKCSRCHTTKRPLSTNKDMDGWTKTVKRMQEKQKDWINNDESRQIIDYLFTVQGK